jgi:hypothetical protein
LGAETGFLREAGFVCLGIMLQSKMARKGSSWRSQ